MSNQTFSTPAVSQTATSAIHSPIVLLAFNRPQHTARVFAAIREQRPARLFVVADGPRGNHPEDAENCAAVRKIVTQIDWPCEARFDFATVNMGCRGRVSSGLNWVFSCVDSAIILEDDCLPHPDFFSFCQALLARYADDDRVWVITGNNFQQGRKRGDAAYYFSRYNHCWGWATWRRAWSHFQADIPFWPDWQHCASWQALFPDRIERHFWQSIFDGIRANKWDSWAYPWTACVWYHGGLTATPNVNLVSNIGFGPDATHTKRVNRGFANLPTRPLGKLTHPGSVIQDIKADRYAFDYGLGGRWQRWPRKPLRIPLRVLFRLAKSILKTY